MDRTFPAFLIVAGICAAAFFAVEASPIEFAVACLVVAIGVHEWNETGLHQEDSKRFER